MGNERRVREKHVEEVQAFTHPLADTNRETAKNDLSQLEVVGYFYFSMPRTSSILSTPLSHLPSPAAPASIIGWILASFRAVNGVWAGH